MTTTIKRGLVVVAAVLLMAVTAVTANSVLRWTGHGLNHSVPEPASLALAGLGLVGLSQTLMRKFGKA